MSIIKQIFGRKEENKEGQQRALRLMSDMERAMRENDVKGIAFIVDHLDECDSTFDRVLKEAVRARLPEYVTLQAMVQKIREEQARGKSRSYITRFLPCEHLILALLKVPREQWEIGLSQYKDDIPLRDFNQVIDDFISLATRDRATEDAMSMREIRRIAQNTLT